MCYCASRIPQKEGEEGNSTPLYYHILVWPLHNVLPILLVLSVDCTAILPVPYYHYSQSFLLLLLFPFFLYLGWLAKQPSNRSLKRKWLQCTYSKWMAQTNLKPPISALTRNYHVCQSFQHATFLQKTIFSPSYCHNQIVSWKSSWIPMGKGGSNLESRWDMCGHLILVWQCFLFLASGQISRIFSIFTQQWFT